MHEVAQSDKDPLSCRQFSSPCRRDCRFSHKPPLTAHLVSTRYMYEVAQSDKDPLSYAIFERYQSKKHYVGPHRSSAAFAQFRPQMKALQDVRAHEGLIRVWVGRDACSAGRGCTAFPV
jgi:hypothetical protein